MSKLYHKIETLFKFNQEHKKFEYGNFYNENVELLKDNKWLFTEKVDGTNLRIIWDGYNLTYGGRTERSIFSKEEKEFIEKSLLKDKEISFEELFQDQEVVIYGELFGGKIQGGLYSEEMQFMVFDIFIRDVYLEYHNVVDIAIKLDFDFVPLIMKGTIDEALKYVIENKNSSFAFEKLEGLVGKPVGDFKDRLGKRIVIKIKKRDIENSIIIKENKNE